MDPAPLLALAVEDGTFQLPIDQSVTIPVNFSRVSSSPDSLSDPIREPKQFKLVYHFGY